jgi:hypothetical protein
MDVAPINPAVLVVIPAFRRPKLLARALTSLEGQGPALRRVLVVNNSSDAETVDVTRGAPVAAEVLDLGCNLGTAGGIAAGMRHLLRDPTYTHAWILDDDACATPGALEAMLQAMARGAADAAAPLITDETGVVQWFPGPLPGRPWDVIRTHPRPEEFLAKCGDAPLNWNWAMWASLVVSRRALEAIGEPRLDLWYQYSDLEYTLRLTSRFRGVLAPRAVCAHLPPPETMAQRRRKDLLGLQSGNFVNTRLRHGWRAMRHMPGNHLRYLRRHGWGPAVWKELVGAFLRGALLGRPASDDAMAVDYARAAATLKGWQPAPRSNVSSTHGSG